jgi:hypothetical protein
MVYQRVFMLKIQTQQDMAKLEQTVASMLGGEHLKCSFIRSKDFISLRLRALYTAREHSEALVIYGQNLKISLDMDNNATVFLLDPGIEQDPTLCPYTCHSLLGKRACPDDPSAGDEPLGLAPL